MCGEDLPGDGGTEGIVEGEVVGGPAQKMGGTVGTWGGGGERVIVRGGGVAVRAYGCFCDGAGALEVGGGGGGGVRMGEDVAGPGGVVVWLGWGGWGLV